jgi:hypothetical protein
MACGRNWLVLGLQSGLLSVLVGCSQPASAVQQTPSPVSQTGLTVAERAELAHLETTPLNLPSMPADGHCPTGPESSVAPYPNAYRPLNGTGPIYGQGGPRTDSSENSYFDVTLFTDPTVQGVVLSRGQRLDGPQKIFYIGQWAAGPVVGTDTVAGKQVELHAELALPGDRRPSNTDAAPGWGIWEFRMGIRKPRGCTGFQIDTASTSEAWVVAAG